MFTYIIVGWVLICVSWLLLLLLSMSKIIGGVLPYFFNSNKYSSEADRKIRLLLAKYEANLISATVDTHTITFSDGSEIWIANKYYSYGYLYSVSLKKNGSIVSATDNELCDKKPKLKTFLKVIKLEKSLRNMQNC